MRQDVPHLARDEVNSLLPKIREPYSGDWNALNTFSDRFRGVMVWSRVNDTSPMTLEKARIRAQEYLLALEALYSSDASLDTHFTNEHTRREQGLIWLGLLDSCFQAMKNLSVGDSDGSTNSLRQQRSQILRIHNSRWQNERRDILREAA